MGRVTRGLVTVTRVMPAETSEDKGIEAVIWRQQDGEEALTLIFTNLHELEGSNEAIKPLPLFRTKQPNGLTRRQTLKIVVWFGSREIPPRNEKLERCRRKKWFFGISVLRWSAVS